MVIKRVCYINHMERKSILIACNSLDYILIHKTLNNDFILDKANTCEDILRLGDANQYDLLLIDISLLKPDYRVIARFKKENIPVVALSPEPYDAKDKELHKAGCCACYIKPIRQELFADFIRPWIQENEMN